MLSNSAKRNPERWFSGWVKIASQWVKIASAYGTSRNTTLQNIHPLEPFHLEPPPPLEPSQFDTSLTEVPPFPLEVKAKGMLGG